MQAPEKDQVEYRRIQGDQLILDLGMPRVLGVISDSRWDGRLFLVFGLVTEIKNLSSAVPKAGQKLFPKDVNTYMSSK